MANNSGNKKMYIRFGKVETGPRVDMQKLQQQQAQQQNTQTSLKDKVLGYVYWNAISRSFKHK